MTLTRLTNESWGFASMCFVCEEANERGLQVPFFHDGEAGTVTADFTLTEAFSGAPALAHGGILMALCDEAMCWATIAVARTWAMTAGNTHRFLRPVRLGRPYLVEARVAGRDNAGLRTTATITSRATGKVSVEAEAVFSPIGATRASDAIGTEVSAQHRPYLKER